MINGSENSIGEGTKKKSKKRKYDALNEYISPKLDIKIESDTDYSPDKKKSKKSKLKHEFSMKLEKTSTDEESFLNVKVKEEESKLELLKDCYSIKKEYEKSGDNDSKIKHKKSKKNKLNKFPCDQSSVEAEKKVRHKENGKISKSKEIRLNQNEPSVLQSDGNASQAECCNTEDSFSEASNKIKKKKHDKKACKERKVFNNMEIEDYFSAAETVIVTQRKRTKSFKNKKVAEQIVFEEEVADELHLDNGRLSSDDDRIASEVRQRTVDGPSACDSERERRSARSPSTSADAGGGGRELRERLAEYVARAGAAGRHAAEGGAAGGALAEAEAALRGAPELEVWLVSAPRGVHPATVRSLEPGARWRLRAAGGARYVAAAAAADARAPALAVLSGGGRSLRALRPLASLRFHLKPAKREPSPEPLAADARSDVIPLPATKTRHPLFGADYAASMRIPETVTEKLENARKIKKKSKKTKKLNINDATNEVDEVDHVKAKKKTARTPRAERDDAAWRSARAMELALFHY